MGRRQSQQVRRDLLRGVLCVLSTPISVFSSYRMVSNAFSQRFGDLAGPSIPTLRGLTYTLIVANGTTPEKVFVPYVANFVGTNFTDSASLCVPFANIDAVHGVKANVMVLGAAGRRTAR